MNVVFLSTWFPWPPDNGSKIRVHYLLRALGQKHKVTLCSFAFGTAQPEATSDLHSFCADIRVVRLDPFATNRAGAFRTFLSARPVVSRPIPAMSQLVADVARSGSFDVAIASTEMMADYVLNRPLARANVLEEHNSLSRWMRERYEAQTNPLQRLRCWASWYKTRRYEAALFNRFDLVTMVSEPDRAATAALPGFTGRVEVVPNGVDCGWNTFDPEHLRQPYNLVFNGSLTYRANLGAVQWFVSHVLPRVRRELPQTTLTITGSLDGVDTSALVRDEAIHLTGHLDDVREAVASASVCIVPLREGGGSRLKVLEALALGTPVVSTTKGVEGLALENGTHALVADSAHDFAAAVIRLLRDPVLRLRLAEAGRRLVESSYDWSRITPTWVALVEEVAARARP